MILTISAKCSDLFSACLVNDKGETIAEHDGYVLECLPGEHYGDYVMLDIDAETGQIQNWKPVSMADFRPLHAPL